MGLGLVTQHKRPLGRHPDETPRSLMIDLHYRNNKMDQGWKADRVRALCVKLQITIHELARLFLIEPKHMKHMLRKDFFPPTIALHFAILERWAWVKDDPDYQADPDSDILPCHHIT